MANFKALPRESQSGDDVLYFDADAKPTELYECATFRLSVAHSMLEAIGAVMRIEDERALPAVASAAALLISDAEGMLKGLYGVIRSYEDRSSQLPVAEVELRH